MPARPPMTRRAVLGAAGLGLGAGTALVGCDTTATPSSPSRATPTPTVDPDISSASDALGLVGGVRDEAEAVLQRFPGLRTTLEPVVAMHRAHYDALAGAVPDGAASSSPSTPAIPAGRRAALHALGARERALHGQLVGLAQRAESGTFARMLASMAAAVGQRVEGWPA